MKNLSILLLLSLVTSCASPVSHFITEDDFNNHKKFESEIDENIENKIDKTKIKEFEEAIDSLSNTKQSLANLSYSMFLTDTSPMLTIDNIENEYNLFLEKKSN